MLTLDKSKLSAVLALCEKAIERKNTIPILQNVMIVGEAGDEAVTLTATNLDIEISARLPARLEASVAFTCPGALLKDIAGKAAADDIVFEPTERDVTVRAGRARFKLPLLPVADFPTLARPENPVTLTIPADALAARLQAVAFAISTEETRYYLNGIFLEHDTKADGAKQLILVATDGHRLARRALAVEGLDTFPGVILPRATVPVVLKMIEKSKETVTIEITEAKIRFAHGETAIVSKLVDGTFPDYKRVIPEGSPQRASAVVAALSAAIDRVSTVANGRDSRMRFELAEGALTLKASSADIGEAEDTIACEAAEPHATAFNGKYALEALANLGAERVELCQASPGDPAILRAPGATTDLIVLMPMRL